MFFNISFIKNNYLNRAQFRQNTGQNIRQNIEQDLFNQDLAVVSKPLDFESGLAIIQKENQSNYWANNWFSNQINSPINILSNSLSNHLNLMLASAFLVSIPVFFQAPLVRHAPWLSLIFTVGWLAIAQILMSKNQAAGSLVWGFSLSWLCGTIYWGWLRAEPLWHLPIEAIAVPWAVWAISQKSDYLIGAWFYLASLLGTAATDLYIFFNNLLPHWKAIMRLEDMSDFETIRPIMNDAILHLQTNWGISWAAIISIFISLLGFGAMRSPNHRNQAHNWAFAGALLSTIFVDGLFAIFACAGVF